MIRLTAVIVLLAQAAAPSFEVASVKPHRGPVPRIRTQANPVTGQLTLTGVTVKDVIVSAYGLQPQQLQTTGHPVLDQQIDVVAKATPGTPVRTLQQMLQPLLAERFGLTTHRALTSMDAYVLVTATPGRLGRQLRPATDPCVALVGTSSVFANAQATGQPLDGARCGLLPVNGPGHIVGRGFDMNVLAAVLAPSLGRPVIDGTGLLGRYDLEITYTPEAFTAAALARRGGTAPPGVDPDGPSIFTALQEQLGLRLDARRADVDTLVIDAISGLREN